MHSLMQLGKHTFWQFLADDMFRFLHVSGSFGGRVGRAGDGQSMTMNGSLNPSFH